MGIIIKATGVSTDITVKSSITHAGIAGRECLRAAAVSPGDVDLLINVGVYRDNNMVEPSMAALIQKEVGINLDFAKAPAGAKPAFSVDLMNGACGLLNAIQVASAFLMVDKAQHVLIVSSDAHPSNQDAEGFPYAALGGAMLLARSDRADAGFGRLQVRDAAEDEVGLAGYLEVQAHGGRGKMTIEMEPRYQQRLIALAADAAAAYAKAEGLDLTRTLLVTSQATPDFGAQVARRLALGEEAAVRLGGLEKDPHTSALTLAYHAALRSGQAKRYDQMLFLAAGAGLTSACAVYRA